jgi:O-antigen/teichoic acid export membrane protein
VENLDRLDRGAAWTVVGNLLNILPALLELVLLRKFGLGIWGEFLTAQAVVLVAGRVSCLGLDKGLLWFLPTQRGHGLRNPAFGAALQAFAVGTVLALALAFPLMQLSLPRSSDMGLGRFVILAIPFFAASEVLIGALQGIQRFHYRPLLRDLGVSAFLAPIALGLAIAGNIGPVSLGIGFLAGHFLILSISVYAWMKETNDLRGGSLLPPKALTKYSGPIWLAESVNSANQRVTVLLLSRFAASSVVGAFGVISMVWQVATMMRRAFETPLVTITASSSPGEIRDLYKKVVQRVLVWQFPVVIALAAGGGSILRLISPGLGSIEHHLGLLAMVVCSYLASGPWMAQQILAGLGDSKRLLFSYSLGALIGIVLLVALAPHLGIVGAGLAQGGAVIASGLFSAWQVKRYANLPGYPDGYLPKMGWTLVAASACTGAWLLRVDDDSPWRAWPAWLLGLGVICAWLFIRKPFRNLRG